MLSLPERMQKANQLLAPYAVQHGGGKGRAFAEPEDETRFPFQRDRDRIIHTQSFRRLKGKTQVFVAGHGDHYRTRLTHTMEVAQISRDIARTLALNEDLAECIALAHDLGHPPFGHAGEAALDTWMKTHGSRFEHNEQSLRIVTILEEHSSLYKGLNLNEEVLDGLKKHHTPHDSPDSGSSLRSPTLEAQLVNIADEIAYTCHDVEDGLKAGLFEHSEILKIPLPKIANAHAEKRRTSLRGALINILITDLYEASEKTLSSQRITTLDGVEHARFPLIRFSEKVAEALSELRTFLMKSFYSHPQVLSLNERGKNIISYLLQQYSLHPSIKVAELQTNTGGALEEATKDYIAGMTDAYALLQAKQLGFTNGAPQE
ncbi:MAG: dNTP triphosphohydrolase [Candidatus Peribacteraceae bacterium]|nr:dNTP triphosphohydrolase [Candidatus Peribacteraceae bacterium]